MSFVLSPLTHGLCGIPVPPESLVSFVLTFSQYSPSHSVLPLCDSDELLSLILWFMSGPFLFLWYTQKWVRVGLISSSSLPREIALTIPFPNSESYSGLSSIYRSKSASHRASAMIMWSRVPSAAPVSQMSIRSCPACSTSDLASCLWTGKAAEDGSRPQAPWETWKKFWLLASGGLSSDHYNNLTSKCLLHSVNLLF